MPEMIYKNFPGGFSIQYNQINSGDNMNELKTDDLVKLPIPIILYYGEKKLLAEDFAKASEWGKKNENCAIIDLSNYSHDRKAYYFLLRDIIQQIAGPQDFALVKDQLEIAVKFAESSVQEDDHTVEKTARLWTENFAKFAMGPFIQFFLTRQFQNDQKIAVLLNNFQTISPVLQIAFERYLVPGVSGIFTLKFFLFHEGSQPPSWKTYYFEKSVYPVSRIFRQLVSFQNPYIAGRAIQPMYSKVFVGRDKAMKAINDYLMNPQSALVLISGDRRIGKTSLLMNLGKYINISESFFPVLLDMQGFDKPKDKSAASAKVLWKIAFKISEELRNTEIVREDNFEYPIPDEFLDAPKHHFENNFLKLRVKPLLKSKKLLFLVDEFEILEEWYREDLIADFLGFMEKTLIDRDDLAFIFAGVQKLARLRISKFFRSSDYCEVGFLERPDAEKLVKEPVADVIEYSPEAVELLLKYSGCHPYFTQLMCFWLVSRAKDFSISGLTENDVNAVAENAVERSHANFIAMWDDSSESEKNTMIELVNSTDDFDKQYPPDNLKPESDFETALKNLCRREVLDYEGGFYHFRVGLFYRWIKRKSYM